eukprot:m.25683 g.25683  ORF g.25683 m.25683 type:complete len:362 (-) comp13608_c0_seq1:56-1141(-)
MGGFEHDFLNYNTLSVPFFRQNFGAAEKWLRGMNQAALELGVPIQYCMSTPTDIMASVMFGATTNARASGDYAGSGNHDIGASSLFMFSLGIRPSKDNFWTMPSSKSPYGAHGYPGTNAELNLLLATFSTGPVGIADEAGNTNATLVMESCMNTSGRLLHPSKPLTKIDHMYAPDWDNGDVWATFSQISGVYFYFALGIDVKKDFYLQRNDLYPVPPAITSQSFVVVTRRSRARCLANGTLALASSCATISTAVNPSWPNLKTPSSPDVAGDFTWRQVFISPLDNSGWVLLGELTKAVFVSPYRFKSVHFTGSGIEVGVAGDPGEAVTLVALKPLSDGSDFMSLVQVVKVPQDGYVEVVFG